MYHLYSDRAGTQILQLTTMSFTEILADAFWIVERERAIHGLVQS
jgi:hypothetical protein